MWHSRYVNGSGFDVSPKRVSEAIDEAELFVVNAAEMRSRIRCVLIGQNDLLVNYAEWHRAGLRVGTVITERKANFLVNRRMNKNP